MEKLELKHLVPYLPHSLKMKPKSIDSIHTLCSLVCNNSLFVSELGAMQRISAYKPILRPLSDMVNPITHNESEFIPIAELLKIAEETWFVNHLGSKYSVIESRQNGSYAQACFEYHATKSIELNINFACNYPSWITNKLCEWHFDIYGLIEKGLSEIYT